MKFHTILFDLDGTLTDSQEGIVNCVKYALEYMGIQETDEEKLKLFIGPPLDEMFMELYDFTPEQALKARIKYRERFADVGMFENKPYEGIKELLAGLQKKGIVLGVATSKPEFYSRKILDRFQLSPYFDVISGADLEGNHVSKAVVVREAMRRLGKGEGDTEGILMVGDRKYDVEGARECGLPCVGVGFGFAKPGELEKAGAAYQAETMEDLKELLHTLTEGTA
ncbi:MAG: HAD-IA family hydrolase [Lachnospiraceae bacterium]|jgi:phosphoglycolate phosphatase|nr:HAD-IA family hydrolase [Lachnospiraceae bacterium]MCI8995490.1 HAD-IA family hydrolase [Lachnospiraceae bacterium]MCI9135767.1 HAD-IA family hydrolase [Lachnospiraceae bacterium]